jgi:sporulation protein YlmC with PRC-barrel domain
MKTQTDTVLSADTLAGNSVRNSKGDDLGTIKAIMLDVPRGRIAYAVLSVGGFFGLGDKLFAVPWSALRLDHEKKAFIFDATKKQLDEAEGFDKDSWPHFADKAWSAGVHKHWGQTPYWD